MTTAKAAANDAVKAVPDDKTLESKKAARAMRYVSGMENDLNRISGMMRMFIVMDLEGMCVDERDVKAIMELTYTMQDALDRVFEAREAACDYLRPLAFPSGPGRRAAT